MDTEGNVEDADTEADELGKKSGLHVANFDVCCKQIMQNSVLKPEVNILTTLSVYDNY